MSKHAHTRPFANLLSLNEMIAYIMAHAFTLGQKWMAKDIYEIAKEMDAFPMSDNQTYVYRIMKNLAQKEILFMNQAWSTTERPTLHYSLSAKGQVFFYSGQMSVMKTTPEKLKALQLFLADLESNLQAASAPPPSADEHVTTVVGVGDYYDWLLLRAAEVGRSPHAYKDFGAEFGKPVNLSYLYKLHGELQEQGYLAGDWITTSGRLRQTELERALSREVQSAKNRLMRIEKTGVHVQAWLKSKRASSDPSVGS
ncbi:hypothetical protein EDM56_27700 [Brevibacillus fluminis]|uniref:Transcription regulator PadR N-terminal domain-containing protein n=1 Tax=Brevibacillus fluminis TaxID=511487 RepID=A0A3M8CZ89_9BACL|nr:hypothetical protein [Brevibacillus fluminis]RNB80195.1 hypothetical protein EDM56_27700 [Brevibacillus fluminis]